MTSQLKAKVTLSNGTLIGLKRIEALNSESSSTSEVETPSCIDNGLEIPGKTVKVERVPPEQATEDKERRTIVLSSHVKDSGDKEDGTSTSEGAEVDTSKSGESHASEECEDKETFRNVKADTSRPSDCVDDGGDQDEVEDGYTGETTRSKDATRQPSLLPVRWQWLIAW